MEVNTGNKSKFLLSIQNTTANPIIALFCEKYIHSETKL